MKSWQEAFDINYRLVADPTIQTEGCVAPKCDANGQNCKSEPIDPPCDMMHRYYVEGGIPFSMVVSTKDMKIRYKDHGYSTAQVLFNIKLWVYNPPE